MTRPTRLALLATAAAPLLALAALRAADDDLAKELPRIPPKSPAEALKGLTIQHGFRVEPIATEPLVTDPVHVCYDADGALYAVEMRGYPYPEDTPSGNVRRLVDKDGDGKFDASTIFVDGLSWPTSVVPSDGGVFICVPPEILYAKDTDGDGVADVKKVAFSGFGTQNVQALANGLLWGPDGWIYGVGGGNGGEIKNHLKSDAKPVSIRGRDFRFRPDGSAFEAISGGGQFGHAFDDWGHRFTSNNSNHIRQIILPSWSLERNPALVAGAVLDDIAAEGAAAPVFRISQLEPWRIVRTRQRAADPVMKKRLPPTELVPG
ncbi:MAG: dehydrogenase, partial [Thermoleophilia bacterium]|nr:dehydrogenase [Thermoleophilia bacterium]